MHSTLQGTVGLGAAIAEFTKRGWQVSVPLIDGQKYDLLVDNGKKILKVQVKTTSSRDNRPNSNYKVTMCSRYTNTSGTITKPFDNKDVDFVFILCDNGDMYLIPSKEINVTSKLTITESLSKYMV